MIEIVSAIFIIATLKEIDSYYENKRRYGENHE